MLGLFVFVACSSDDIENPYAQVSSISIDSCSVLFQAAPGTGYVALAAPNGITKVVSEQPWCTATINGTMVSVQVEENSGMLGRSSVLTIYSGNDYAQVTVQQMGIIFALDVLSIVSDNDDAVTLRYSMKTNTDVAITSNADWLQASASGNTLVVSMTENTTGHMRKGYVYYTAGTATDSIPVIQYDFDKDIAGSYRLFYKETADAAEWHYFNAVVSKDSISLPDLGLRLPASFDKSALSINLQSGQYCGRFGAYYIYNAFQLADGYWTAYYSSTTAWGSFDYDEEDGIQYCMINESTSTRAFMGISLIACSSQEFNASTDQGALANLYSPVLQKVAAEGGAKASFKLSSFRQAKQ